jgi:hypothetical protein
MGPSPERPVYSKGSRSRSNVGWIRLILVGTELAPYAMAWGATAEECDERADHLVRLLNADAPMN